MKPFYAAIVTACLILAPSVWANPASVEINFSVPATGHTVKGSAEALPFDATIAGDTLALSIEVPIESMDTGNKKRDKEMRHTLREDLQPVLIGTLPATPMAEIKPEGDEPGVLNLMFSMAGKELPVEATVSDWAETDEILSFTVRFELSQKAYDLEPISKMGFLKVKDIVTVVAQFEIGK